jgi:hypothetical protein
MQKKFLIVMDSRKMKKKNHSPPPQLAHQCGRRKNLEFALYLSFAVLTSHSRNAQNQRCAKKMKAAAL